MYRLTITTMLKGITKEGTKEEMEEEAKRHEKLMKEINSDLGFEYKIEEVKNV